MTSNRSVNILEGIIIICFIGLKGELLTVEGGEIGLQWGNHVSI